MSARVPLAVACSLLFACGDDLVAHPFGEPSFAPTSSSSSAPARQTLVACPLSDPEEGSGCYATGLVCERGRDLDTRCSPAVECDGKRWWHRAATCASSCPASRAEITPGDLCTPGATDDAASEEVCGYRAEVCGCAPAEGASWRWRCVPADPGCPRVRPRIGTPCDTAQTCDYGACVFASGVTLRCVLADATTSIVGASESTFGASGVWLVTELACSSKETTP